MATITPPPMSKPEAQVAVVDHMLREHGRQQASELVLIDKRLYRITVAEVAPEDIPEAARQFVKENAHDT